MKKLIALVLTVAMLVTCFVISASAETAAPSVTVEGPDKVTAGEEIVVKVIVNDAEPNVVGGVQGTVTVAGATISSVDVYDQLAAWNEATDAEDTIYKIDGDKVKFAAVNYLDSAESYTSVTWFEITVVAAEEGNVSVAVSDLVASDKQAQALAINAGDAYTAAIEDETAATLNKVGVLENAIPSDQGIVVNASITLSEGLQASDIAEYGVIYYPTTLLGQDELTYDYEPAIVAKITAGAEKFEQYLTDGEFNAVLRFAFSSDENAAKFLGTKVSSRVYYKTTDGEVFYSKNKDDSDKYISNGIASKAALTTILAFAKPQAENNIDSANVTAAQYLDAASKLSTTAYPDDWYASRKTVLQYAVELAIGEIK